MTARVTAGEWMPLPGALPTVMEPDKVYVIPTRMSQQAVEGKGGELCFTDEVRYLPKAARHHGLPVEFSQSEGERHYLQEFSADPELWSLGLALLNMASDWLILTVSLFIAHRADTQGWSDEQVAELPLRVCVAETSTDRTYQVEGSSKDVLEALQVLQRDSGEKGSDEGVGPRRASLHIPNNPRGSDTSIGWTPP